MNLTVSTSNVVNIASNIIMILLIYFKLIYYFVFLKFLLKQNKKYLTLPGLEPGIFCSVGRRVIHCATRPLVTHGYLQGKLIKNINASDPQVPNLHIPFRYDH